MPISHSRSGATIITGDSIDYYRLCTIRMAVELEMKGVKVTRGKVAWKCAREIYNLGKMGKMEVHAWLCKEVDRLRPQQEHVTEEGAHEVGGQRVQ